MQSLRLMVFGLSLAVIFGLMSVVGMGTASAACTSSRNPLACACSSGGGAANSSACSADGSRDPITGQNGILWRATQFIALVGGVVAVVVIVVAGFSIATSNGDTQKVTKARQAIVGALVGLVLIAVAESAIVFVVGRLN